MTLLSPLTAIQNLHLDIYADKTLVQDLQETASGLGQIIMPMIFVPRSLSGRFRPRRHMPLSRCIFNPRPIW